MAHSGLGVGGERRYSVPSNPLMHDPRTMHSEDLHAWSIYRQNLNSDFTDSALGSTDKSPLPYGNFQLRDTTVQSILSHPRYGPKSALGSNMYTYLKFGLPRVFPPNHNGSQRSGTPKPKTSIGSGMKSVPRIQRHSRGVRETSSGYDSSDNETTTNYKYSRKYRSDPDFRMQNLHPSYQPGMPLSAMQQAGIRNDQHWTSSRNKSISEANLLGVDRPRSQYNRRGSVADFAGDGDHQSYLVPASHMGGRISKAGSQMSVPHSRKHSAMRHTDQLDGYSGFIYPHFYVNNLEVNSREMPSSLAVCGLTMEARSGDVVAVLAPAHRDASALLTVLAGRRKKLSGDIIVNGQPVASSTLRKIVAFVHNDTNLCPNMTVEHTLRFHATLRKPRQGHAQMKMDDRDRINLLIEELGLEQVRDTNVGRLTRSEVRRLNVACQLLLDMAILVLDQPTKEMDIFDTFFLVEYLRNWASTGRIVILSLHPPTYEIFAMLTKVVLISAGRTMFSGYRRDMLPYFASIDYPCPAYKNPSDYYLDLVTLDDLSAAAMLESSGRIEALAAAARAPRGDPRAPRGDPPAPAPLPAPAPAPRSHTQILALIEKSLVFTQMTTLSNVITRVLIAALMSLITGAIFWDIPTTDVKLTQNDRVGFHYTITCLSVWPVLLYIGAREASSMRRHVERDIAVGLYSRTVFILFDQFLELWSAVITWLAYLVPSYAMSGLYAQAPRTFDGFYIYAGYMLLYLVSIQMLCRAAIFLIPMEKTSILVSGISLLLTTLVNGVMLHNMDMPYYVRWLQYVSPSAWTIPELLKKELTEEALKTSIGKELRCTNKQRPYPDIIVQSPCPLPNGTQVLSNYDYLTYRPWNTNDEGFLVALAVFYAIFALVAIIAFVADCTKYVWSKDKKYLKGHKVAVNTP